MRKIILGKKGETNYVALCCSIFSNILIAIGKLKGKCVHIPNRTEPSAETNRTEQSAEQNRTINGTEPYQPNRTKPAA
ncbi:hypothetical protein BpHYR1_034788, partial [Brachionus plicatilis]